MKKSSQEPKWFTVAAAKVSKKYGINKRSISHACNSANYPDTFSAADAYGALDKDYMLIGKINAQYEFEGAYLVPMVGVSEALTKYQNDSRKLITRTQFSSDATSIRCPYSYIEQYEFIK